MRMEHCVKENGPGTFKIALSLLILIGTISCSSLHKETNMEIPFHFFADNFLVVKVRVNNGPERNFIVDTGIGITLISKELCAELNCKTTREFSGQRMSGQTVSVPVTRVASLSVANKSVTDFPVGVFDVERLLPKSGISGFLSLGFFKEFPHTVDYKNKNIRFETAASLTSIRADGSAIKIKPKIQDVAYDIMMPLVLPDGTVINAEVDTGSQALILHERYMKKLGIDTQAKSVQKKTGKDETGHLFDRYFTKLSGPVHLPGYPDMKMDTPNVMFQKIIYDGLIGFHFLREFRVTYDLPRSEVIFRKP